MVILGQWSFSYFELKIILIRLGLSFQSTKSCIRTHTTTDSQSGVITITPNVSGRHRNVFSNL